MKIVVFGGSGLIGTKLVQILRDAGHEAVSASPRSGVDSVTGKGLAEALVGADIVVDVTNSPSFADADVLSFFEASTRNLLAAEKVAGVRHHVALSVVGLERLPTSGYFRAKVAQEALIKNGSIPYSILRATQFFEFIKPIADSATSGDAVRLPHVLMQPVAAADVSATMAKVALGPPLNGTRELAGPEPLPLDDLARRVLGAQKDPRRVISDPAATYYGAAIDDRSLTPGKDPYLGATRLEDWLQQTTGQAGAARS
jgi:uncharacterized protein YbjT (DUF2867 family)